jgi:hypothetical protein
LLLDLLLQFFPHFLWSLNLGQMKNRFNALNLLILSK